jgi:hypothetical protein
MEPVVPAAKPLGALNIAGADEATGRGLAILEWPKRESGVAEGTLPNPVPKMNPGVGFFGKEESGAVEGGVFAFDTLVVPLLGSMRERSSLDDS